MNTTQRTGAPGHAETAAEAVRALNHATIWPGPDGYQEPADVDAVLGHLATLAAYLPQALDQAERWLYEALDAHQVRHDQGADVAHSVHYVAVCLGDARDRSRDLHELLREAREHSSHLASGGETR